MRCAIIGISVLLAVAKTSPTSAAQLSIPDRSLVARSIVEQRSYMDVMLVAEEGQAISLADELRKQKFKVLYRADEVGYFRVAVPPRQVQSLVSHPSVLAVGLGHFRFTAMNQDKHRPSDNSRETKKLTLRDFINLTHDDPTYHGIEEMRISKLRMENSLYDGRGVKIAIIEHSPDPFAPELSYAYDLQGRRTKKITDVYAFSDLSPNSLLARPFRATGWVQLTTLSTTPKQQNIALEGRTIRMPAPGQYEVGFLDETDFHHYDKDLNLDQNPSSKPRTFAVARHPSSSCVWIDTDQDDDLSDEQCHAEYSKGGKGGFFRSSTGEPVGARFYIPTIFREGWINVAVPDDHTHLVTSLAAGLPVLAPNLGSAAPGAQVLPIAVDTSLSTLIEAAIFAARQKSVDIIVNMLGAHLSFAPDNEIDAIIMDRIAQRYDKIVISGAGNYGQKIEQADSHGRGANVLSIGQYVGARAWEAFQGGKYAGGPAFGTSAGPAPDGRLKPDVMGVGYVVTPYIRNASNGSCPRFEPTNKFACFSGTSSATPTATGAVAALVSAARQKKLKFLPSDIVHSIRATARLTEGASTHVQGRGLVDVYAAWQYLNRLVESRESQVRIEVKAPIKTVLSFAAIQPNTGPGLYEREGWSPGDRGSRVIKLRRTSGPDRPLKFSATVLGDYNQTFSAPKELILPLNQEVLVTIGIHPKQPGVHAAILRIADSASAIVAEDVSLTLIAAINLASANKQPLTLDLTSIKPYAMNLYVNVPPETAALKLSHTAGAEVAVFFDGPLGKRGGTLIGRAEMFDKEPGISTGHYENTLHQPTHGVWEISLVRLRNLLPGSGTDSLPIKVNITTLDNTQLHQLTNKAISTGEFTSLGGRSSRFRSKIISTAWKKGSFSPDRSSLPHIVPIDIPTGAQRIEITAAANILDATPVTSERALMVALLQCDAESCTYREGIAGRNKASLLFTAPPRGTWHAIIDGVPNEGRNTGTETQIAYNIFVDKTDESDNLAMPTSAFDRPLCREDAAESPGGFKFVDMKELYNEDFSESLYGFTGEQRLYSRMSIPLARLCGDTLGNRSAVSK